MVLSKHPDLALHVFTEVVRDEIDLTFAGDFGSLSDASCSAWVDDGTFDNAKPSTFHCVLGRDGGVLHDVSVFAQEFVQSVLSDIHAVLAEQLRKFSDKDFIGCVGHGVRKEDLRRVCEDFLLCLDTGGAFFF